MHDIKGEDLIVQELTSKKENEGRLRSSFINDYFLHYNEEHSEIVPIRYYDGTYMTKPHVRTLIKGLENYLNNGLDDDHVDDINAYLIREYRKQFEDSYTPRQKTKRESMSRSKESEGYVYFIKEHFSGTVKIGKSKELKTRLEHFGVKLPFDWDVLKTIKSADYSLTETLLHRKYADKRVNGEWFALSDANIDEIMGERFDDEIQQSISGGGEIYERK